MSVAAPRAALLTDLIAALGGGRPRGRGTGGAEGPRTDPDGDLGHAQRVGSARHLPRRPRRAGRGAVVEWPFLVRPEARHEHAGGQGRRQRTAGRVVDPARDVRACGLLVGVGDDLGPPRDLRADRPAAAAGLGRNQRCCRPRGRGLAGGTEARHGRRDRLQHSVLQPHSGGWSGGAPTRTCSPSCSPSGRPPAPSWRSTSSHSSTNGSASTRPSRWQQARPGTSCPAAGTGWTMPSAPCGPDGSHLVVDGDLPRALAGVSPAGYRYRETLLAAATGTGPVAAPCGLQVGGRGRGGEALLTGPDSLGR